MSAAAEVRGPLQRLLQVPRESIRFRLARNTLWSTSGSAISQALTLLAAMLAARLLGVTHFGQLALIQSTVLMVGTFGEMGATLTTTKFVSSWRVLEPKRTGRLIGVALTGTAVSGVLLALLLGWGQPYTKMGSFAGLSRDMQAACLLLIFDMLNRIQFGALAGLEAFGTSAQIQLVRGVLMVPFVWLGAWWGGLFGAVTGMGLVSLITFATGHWILRRRCRSLDIPLRYLSRIQPDIVSTSMSLWVTSLLLTGTTWLVTVLLSRQPQGLAQVGLYNAADKWKTALLFLPQMLFQVILPMLSSSQADGDYRACRRIVHVAFASTLGITGAAALGVLCFAKPLMGSYGKAFVGGADVLAVAALASVASALYTVGSGALWALGKPTEMLKIDIAKTALFLGLCWLGYAGSASKLMKANLLTFSAGCPIVIFAVYKKLECRKL